MTTVLDTFRLTGRRALVTGGARGLGRVMATALAEAGADVAITSRSPDSARDAAEEIARASNGRVSGFVVDVTIADDIDRLVLDVESAMGPIDILVNNAGVNVRGAVDQISEADWDRVVHTNLKGPFLCARAIGPRMAARGWGRIINVGSVLGMVALAARAPYSSSKAGIINLTRVLALEWATRGVTVNAICPGVFGTDMNTKFLEDPVNREEFMRRIPMARLGDLRDLAGAAVFLASDASSYVTGSTLVVDGGWTAW
jgi:NAD(P)-dependent dehydrogenase (short-subunit alcohol dehydrogenase family)